MSKTELYNSKISIDNFSEIDIQYWRDFVSESDYGSFFQTDIFFNFLKETDYKPYVFLTKNNEGDILASTIAVLYSDGKGLKKLLSRRLIIYGGPVFCKNCSINAVESHLINLKTSLKDKTIYIETRNLSDYTNYKDAFIKCGFDYKLHLNYQVDCSNIDTVNQQISSSKKRQIKKSLKSGASIIQADNLSQVREFYDILKELYKTKVKTPLPQFSFFENFFYSSAGVYLLVEFNGKIIGGIMCPIFDKETIYEWYICGLDGVYKDIYPSVLATWAPIEYACNNNISCFDFMGAGSPDKDYGVRDFKSKFGGELVEHGRFIYICKPLLFKIGELGIKILKKLK